MDGKSNVVTTSVLMVSPSEREKKKRESLYYLAKHYQGRGSIAVTAEDVYDLLAPVIEYLTPVMD